MLQWVFQILVVGAVVLGILVLIGNVRQRSENLGIPTGYGYLDNPASFPIPGSDFNQRQPVRDALVIGLTNTLRISVVGIVLATLLGTLVGVARLSTNWLLRSAARTYVEIIRNIPLLLIVVFSYAGVALVVFPRIEEAWVPLRLSVISNRGLVLPWYEGSGRGILAVAAIGGVAAWLAQLLLRRRGDRTGTATHAGLWAGGIFFVVCLVGWLIIGIRVTAPDLDGRIVTGGVSTSPELFAIVFALVIYTSSHIAEIVRGSIQAVPRGQGEAAEALALSSAQRLWNVVLPQAFRIAVPPIGNQYLNLTKNSTLGAVVSYPELARITSISVANGAPAVPSYLLTLAIFVVLSLVISFLVNIANRRLALVER